MSPEIFKALSNETRLELLGAIRDKQLVCSDPEDCTLDERCCNVGELAKQVDLTQPTVSHHLKELRRAGLIETHKEGRTVYCSLDEETFGETIKFLNLFCLEGTEVTRCS